MIQIDSREGKEVFEAFDKHGIPYEKTYLAVGDIVFNNVCIEHKNIETGDFVQSYWAGHLQKQLLQMQDNFEHNLLILTGDVIKYSHSEHCPRTFTSDRWRGMLCSISLKYPKVHLLHIPKVEELPLYVATLIRKSLDGREPSKHSTELLRNSLTTYDYKLKILTCFPGVGMVKAEKLLKADLELRAKLDAIVDIFIKPK